MHSRGSGGARRGERKERRKVIQWRYLGTSRLIQGTLLIFILIGLVSGGLIEVALPTLVHGPLHGNASAFGIILVAWGAGAFVGAFVAGALGKCKHKGIIRSLGSSKSEC